MHAAGAGDRRPPRYPHAPSRSRHNRRPSRPAGQQRGRSAAGRSFSRRLNQRQPPANAAAAILDQRPPRLAAVGNDQERWIGQIHCRQPTGAAIRRGGERVDRNREPDHRFPRFAPPGPIAIAAKRGIGPSGSRRCRPGSRGPQHPQMYAIGDRRGAPLEPGQRFGGQVLLGAAHRLGRDLVRQRGHRQPIGLQGPASRSSASAGLPVRISDWLPPARRAVRRPLLVDRVAPVSTDTLYLMRPVEGCGHPAVDRRLQRERVGAGFLGPHSTRRVSRTTLRSAVRLRWSTVVPRSDAPRSGATWSGRLRPRHARGADCRRRPHRQSDCRREAGSEFAEPGAGQRHRPLPP